MGNHTKINVDVHSTASIFKDLQAELAEIGYELNFPTEPIHSAMDKSEAAIHIIDIAHVENHADILQKSLIPFVISGLDNLSSHDVPIDILKHSVGFINQQPSLADICINLRLALLWHNERESYSDRIQNFNDSVNNNHITGIAIGILIAATGLNEQECLESLKTACRNKQRRIPDIATEIINTYPLSKSDNIVTKEQLKDWFESQVKHRRQIF